MTGLLHSAQPGKKANGIQGWLGQMQQSPYLAAMSRLINTPVEHQEPTYGLPSTQYQGRLTDLPGAQPAAQSDNSPVEPGGAPPTPVQPGGPATASAPAPGGPAVGTPPPDTRGEAQKDRAAQAATGALESETAGLPRGTFGGITTAVGAPPPQIGTHTVQTPRQVFRSPEEQTLLTKTASAAGDVEGEVSGLVASGFSENEARAIIRAKLMRAASGSAAQSIAGEVQQPDGTWRPAFGIFDRVNQHYINPDTGQVYTTQFRPRTTTGSTSMGADREAISMQHGGLKYAQQTPQVQQQIDQEVLQFNQQQSYARGTGTGTAQIDTELDKPIGPTAAQIYGVPPTTTMRELSGTRTVRPEDTQKIRNLNDIDAQLGTITALIPQVFPQTDPGLGGRITTGFSLAMQELGRTGNITKLNSAIAQILPRIEQMAGVPGSRISKNLLEQAKQQVIDTSPLNGDTLTSAQAKMQVLRELLRQAREDQSLPAAPAGVGVPPPAPNRSTQPGRPQTGRGAAGGNGSTLDQPLPGFVIQDGQLTPAGGAGAPGR